MFELIARTGRAAARRHSHTYPFHLESEVFGYLEREGAFVRTDARNR